MIANALQLRDVAVERGGKTIWTHGSLEIPRGAVVGVIGPNGSGKTTLLEMILGLVEPTTGSMTVLGSAPSKGNDRIGYVPQHYTSLVGDAVRCRELVALGLDGMRYGFGRLSGQQQNMIDSALASVNATDLANKRMSELSGGQQQRIAIAQALVNQPELVLLDEPLASLDLRNQHQIVELIGQLSAKSGATMLLVTHDLNPLLSILTGAIYLLDGHPHYDEIGRVVDEDLLSHLYGTDIRVVRTPQGDLFTRSA